VKRLAILGSTGSIGVSTMQVVKSFEGQFEVTAIAAGRNAALVEEQMLRHRPRIVAVRDASLADSLRAKAPGGTRVLHGPEGLLEVALCPDVDVVVSALVGAVGLQPTYAALEAGRTVALANKEALVVAGERMTECAAANDASILPVDSEHNAIHQCLRGESVDEVRRLWLTASGGPFRGADRERLERVTPDEALAHPTWKMGPKITIDSASLMNKGLEVIEARWLFGLGSERIRVVVHPKSIVHSMVEFNDGSFKAQLGITDMRHPIQYSLTWPDRLATDLPEFDPIAASPLEFEAPDMERFPCLGLAFRALEQGGAGPAVLNAANEVAVAAFLEGRARFLDIPEVIAAVLERHGSDPAADLGDLVEADRCARETAANVLAYGVRT
jgi:1-deoxy-D-xylulose-5-phosphate reductoisomerase